MTESFSIDEKVVRPPKGERTYTIRVRNDTSEEGEAESDDECNERRSYSRGFNA